LGIGRNSDVPQGLFCEFKWYKQYARKQTTEKKRITGIVFTILKKKNIFNRLISFYENSSRVYMHYIIVIFLLNICSRKTQITRFVMTKRDKKNRSLRTMTLMQIDNAQQQKWYVQSHLKYMHGIVYGQSRNITAAFRPIRSFQNITHRIITQTNCTRAAQPRQFFRPVRWKQLSTNNNNNNNTWFRFAVPYIVLYGCRNTRSKSYPI